jgi:preprotein translocase subunit YajC
MYVQKLQSIPLGGVLVAIVVVTIMVAITLPAFTAAKRQVSQQNKYPQMQSDIVVGDTVIVNGIDVKGVVSAVHFNGKYFDILTKNGTLNEVKSALIKKVSS